MSVRTHSVYTYEADTLGGDRRPVVVCRGCGQRWPAERTDTAALEQEPCGTREGA